ncbi:MAG: CBS domain-containing protein [Microthrixaceae bacterium]|nr:CBS domain-containing protein [Microthrixaceae bacterium]
MKNPSIDAVMTAEPVTIDRTEPISEAYALLKKGRFHHLPVLDGDEPVGLVSSTDILELAYDVRGTEERNLMVFLDHQFSIDDAMSTELVTLSEDATVKDAAAVLADGKVHSVLVLGTDADLAGIVTTTDLVVYLHGQL